MTNADVKNNDVTCKVRELHSTTAMAKSTVARFFSANYRVAPFTEIPNSFSLSRNPRTTLFLQIIKRGDFHRVNDLLPKIGIITSA